MLDTSMAADPLRAPWDTPPALSPIAPATCPPPPTLPAEINVTSYYADAAHSVVLAGRKAAYDEDVGSLRDAATMAATMADRYRESGDQASARCAASWLASFASHGALTGTMATNQSVYVQGWIMGAFAVVALKVRPAAESTNDWRQTTDWLTRIADAQVAYYDARTTNVDGRNNHRYWAGFAVMSAGIAGEQRALFDWGVASFRMGAAQITPDGTLPLEMSRAARALHYHLFATAPLVMIAELAMANGLDLYSENSQALLRLIRRGVSGLSDPSFFAERAGCAQEPVRLSAGDIVWAAPYAERFSDADAARMVARAHSTAFVYLGGRPPAAMPNLPLKIGPGQKQVR
jgi:poly(beta-D-mannuronate) lyase